MRTSMPVARIRSSEASVGAAAGMAGPSGCTTGRATTGGAALAAAAEVASSVEADAIKLRRLNFMGFADRPGMQSRSWGNIVRNEHHLA